MKKLITMMMGLVAGVAGATTYTWTGGASGGNWDDPSNWDDGGDANSLGYPQEADAIAKFPPASKSRVRFNSQHTIGTLDLSGWSADVTFVQECGAASEVRLTAATVTLTGGDSTITLDNVALSTLSSATAVALGGNSTLIVKRGADFTSGSFTYNNNARMLVLDGATVSVNETTSYGSTSDFAIITVSNATYKSRNTCFFPHDRASANTRGSIRLEGTHPVFQMAGFGAQFKSSKADSVTHIDFLVPVEGYESAPIQCAAMPTCYMGNSGGNPGSATIAVNILAESPAALKDGSMTTELISWPKGINTSRIVAGTAPNASVFAWGEGAYPATLGATVVGVTTPPPTPATGTATWIGGGNNALASNPANWKDGRLPQTGMDVILSSEGTDSPMTWDAGMKGVKPSSWTQDGYANTVTFETVYETRGDFNELEITGNVDIQSGKWMSAYNSSKMPGDSKPATGGCSNKFRLKARIGGNLTVGTNASIDATGCGGDAQPVAPPQFDGGTYGGPGGRLSDRAYVSQTIFGSITEPVHLGAKGNWGVGGGAIHLTVGGSTRLDGSLKANSVSNSHYPGSGGSIFLRTGTLAGAGTIAANGFNVSSQASSSGGRVAVILTTTGADFSNFDIVNQASAVCPSTGKNRGSSGTIYAETPANRKDHGWLIMKDYGAGPLDLNRAMRVTYPGTMVCDYDRLTLTNNACVRFAVGETLVLTNTVLEISDVAGKENGFWFAGGKIRLPESAEEWNIGYPVRMYSPVLPVDGRDIHVAASGSLTFNSVVSDLDESILNEGSLCLNEAELRVRRNWTNRGTFASSADSTVRFVDAAIESVVSGNSAFELLICEEPGKSIVFEAGSVQTVTRSFLMNGGEDERVTLSRGGESGSWGLNASGNAVVFCQNLTVTDSDASAGAEITAYSSEGVDCQNWVFAGEAKNTWLGTASTDFSDGANWSFGHAPEADEELEVSSANPMTIGCDIRFASITLSSEANVTISGTVSVTGDVVLTNSAVLAWNRPGAVGGSLYVHDGTKLTHSANGSTMVNWLELAIAGNVRVAPGGAIDVSEKGFSGSNKGPGAPSANRGSSYGGRGYPQDNNPAPSCYGSIYCPDQLGSSGNWSGPGGGAVKLTVGGTLSVEGLVKASGGKPQTVGSNHYDGTGGSIWLTARRMEGAGAIQARNAGYEGSGGRIALYLTGEGETFEAFSGVVDAKATSSSSGGTVYYQLAGQELGTGRIVVSGSNVDGVSSSSVMTDVPSSRLADADVFTQRQRPTLEVGNGAANITADIHLADLVLTGSKGVVRLNGHAVFVYARRHALGTDETKQVIPGGTEENPGQIIWVPRGFKIIVR